MSVTLEEFPMEAVIFYTENAVFKFTQKEVTEHLIAPESKYDFDEVNQLLKLISTATGETLLNSDDHRYFGYVALDLISEGMGTVVCKICRKTYDAGQLKEFSVG